jgi:hypothetical protein
MSTTIPSETHNPIDPNEEHKNDEMSQSELEGVSGGKAQGGNKAGWTQGWDGKLDCPPGAMC